VFKNILEQTKRELKRKRGAEDDGDSSDDKKGRKNKFRKFKKNEGKGGADDGNPDRESDPERFNENVRANWKMSANKFRNVISPHLSECPKLDDKSVCAMYNIVGRCYFGSQCRHSHDKLLSDGAADAMEKWIKDCKKKAKDSPNNEKKKGGKKKED
jgi:hypothetical protein